MFDEVFKHMLLGRWAIRIIEVTAITVTMAAICQELEKPKEERRWHGKVGFIPYDFRLPTIERVKALWWNPDDSQIIALPVWGIGWGINFFALFERMRIIGEIYVTEEDFLMPTPTLRRILEHRPANS
jgi:hypothetical protein